MSRIVPFTFLMALASILAIGCNTAAQGTPPTTKASPQSQIPVAPYVLGTPPSPTGQLLNMLPDEVQYHAERNQTTIQRRETWRTKFQGKRVRWSGRVFDIQPGNRALIANFTVQFKPNLTQELARITPGQTVYFEATLTSLNQSRFFLDDAELITAQDMPPIRSITGSFTPTPASNGKINVLNHRAVPSNNNPGVLDRIIVDIHNIENNPVFNAPVNFSLVTNYKDASGTVLMTDTRGTGLVAQPAGVPPNDPRRRKTLAISPMQPFKPWYAKPHHTSHPWQIWDELKYDVVSYELTFTQP